MQEVKATLQEVKATLQGVKAALQGVKATLQGVKAALKETKAALQGTKITKIKTSTMAFRKKEAPEIINQATLRLTGMQQIDTDQGTPVDYGGPGRVLTVATFSAKISDYNSGLKEYNNLLQQADAAGNELKALAQDIASDYTAVLSSAIGKFGDNGNEIEILGGTRKDERKKPKKKGAPNA